MQVGQYRPDILENRAVSKTAFTVVCDIYNTTSFTGTQFNPIFNLDLKQVVRDIKLLERPYKITYSYRMATGLAATSGLCSIAAAAPYPLYSLHMDFKKAYSIYQQAKPQPYAGNLNVEIIVNAATPTTCRLNSAPTDNTPMYIPNLLGVTSVQLATIINSTGGVFNVTNDATINAVTKYIIYLYFEEC
jgi:hypothetical protein